MTDTPGDDGSSHDPYGPPQAPYGQPQQPSGHLPYGADQPAYGQPQGFPPGGYGQEHPRATTSLVLGILGLVLCGVVAPFAWRMGKRAVEEIDASNGQLTGRGSAQAGYVLGLIGTILLGIGLVLVVLLIVFAIVVSVGSASS